MAYSLTILTPTYNRAYTLSKLYESLLAQTNKNFIWMVIDDGSTDNTKELIQKYIREDKVNIRYIFQENGGKHRAINTGIKEIMTDATFIVDSDDVLTEDAVETIFFHWHTVENENLVNISFLRGYTTSEAIGKKFSKDYEINNLIDIRYNQNITGDKAEVVNTKILKEMLLPTIENEKFMSEGILWKGIAKRGNSLFINKIIYITEYLEDGYTSSGRMLLINNPLGAMLNAKMAMTDEFTLKIRLRNALLYIAYGYVASKGIKEIVQESNQKILVQSLLPFGWMLYKYWKFKYKF